MQRRQFLEGASTNPADMGLYLAVVEQMLVVRLLEGEGPGADLACVRHLAGVEPLVLLQKVLGGEGLAAHIALPQLRGGRARLRRTGGLLEHAQRPTQRVWLGCGARGVISVAKGSRLCVSNAIANAQLGRGSNCTGGRSGCRTGIRIWIGIGAGHAHHVHYFQVDSKGALHSERLGAEMALVGLLVLYKAIIGISLIFINSSICPHGQIFHYITVCLSVSNLCTKIIHFHSLYHKVAMVLN